MHDPWAARCPKFKDYILPLIFLKRLSDVFDDEVAQLAEEFGDREDGAKLVEQDHKLVRFYIPQKARWSFIAEKTTGLGEVLTDAVRAVARENPRLPGVIDVTDFNATTAGQRIVDDGRLAALVQVLNDPDHRLGLETWSRTSSAGPTSTCCASSPRARGRAPGSSTRPARWRVLMASHPRPAAGMTVYDPCCGSAGLLIKCHLRLLETQGKETNGRLSLPSSVAPLRLFGQEINSSTFAMARMNAFLHDMEADIALGDTMHRPAFTEGDGRLRQFDIVTANPMWNQKFPAATYENDTHERFSGACRRRPVPTGAGCSTWSASLKDGGRMAVVLDTGAVSRGSGNQGSNKERDIRKAFVEADLVEAVVLLPENLFYNTTAPGIVLVLNRGSGTRAKSCSSTPRSSAPRGDPRTTWKRTHPADRPGVPRVAGRGGSLRSYMAEAVKNDYNLSPSRYVSTGGDEEVLPLEEAVVLLQEAEEERAKRTESWMTF